MRDLRSDDAVLRRARPMMGTLVGITLRGNSLARLDEVARDTFREIERLEAILSEWRPDSAISAVNRQAGRSPVRIPDELAEVVAVATNVARATEGAFDCSWAALGSLWSLEAPGFRPPDAQAIAAALVNVDYRDVLLDDDRRTLFLRRPGMRIGLGGIAKAYIAESAADYAVANGASHVLVDAGGDLVARGRSENRPWTVGIRDPRPPGELLAAVELRNEAMATSGDYEHFAEIDGRRYHHILDPRTGCPATRSRGASVVAPHGALADALATALFVLGPDGLDVVSSFAGVAALIVDADGGVHVSAGICRFGESQSLARLRDRQRTASPFRAGRGSRRCVS